MDTNQLAKALLQIPEFKSKSVALLEQRRTETGEIWPRIRPSERSICVQEMEKYSENCRRFYSKLSSLKPIALVNESQLTESVFL